MPFIRVKLDDGTETDVHVSMADRSIELSQADIDALSAIARAADRRFRQLHPAKKPGKVYSVNKEHLRGDDLFGAIGVVLLTDYRVIEQRLATAEKLLIDAKRMAEFGDINADMEDDGIGWKPWYLAVSEFFN